MKITKIEPILAGGYKMKDYLKMGAVLCLIRFLAFIIYVPIVFPLK